jgi:hypothetical protein
MITKDFKMTGFGEFALGLFNGSFWAAAGTFLTAFAVCIGGTCAWKCCLRDCLCRSGGKKNRFSRGQDSKQGLFRKSFLRQSQPSTRQRKGEVALVMDDEEEDDYWEPMQVNGDVEDAIAYLEAIPAPSAPKIPQVGDIVREPCSLPNLNGRRRKNFSCFDHDVINGCTGEFFNE